MLLYYCGLPSDLRRTATALEYLQTIYTRLLNHSRYAEHSPNSSLKRQQLLIRQEA
jgi:hypothetical protein